MAGDIGVDEKLIVVPLHAIGMASQIRQSAVQAGARIFHQYGPRVMVVVVPEDRLEQVRTAIEPAELITDSDGLASLTTDDLDPVGTLGLTAFRTRLSQEYAAVKQQRPHDGVSWDAGGDLLPPNPPLDLRQRMGFPDAENLGGTTGADDSVIGTTSRQMTGSIAVGIIIVSGPTTDLQFDANEIQWIVTEVQNGLTWLASQNQKADISWHYDIQTVTVNVAPGGTDKEALWRDPAMVSLGYPGDMQGVYDYIEHIKTEYGTQWCYVGYFTKYPLDWYAYSWRGGPRLVMEYDNGSWGTKNIDRVFAHETGHIFQAPDEYLGCTCGGAWGIYDAPNGNCVACTTDGVLCIMQANTFSLCSWTPLHFGFPQ